MKLTHCYSKQIGELHSITEDCSDEILSQLANQQGKAYRRFRNFEWYIATRKETGACEG